MQYVVIINKKKKKKLAKLVARNIEETYKLSIDDFPKKKNKKQKLFDTSCGP
jgi:uncharacterized protein YacL